MERLLEGDGRHARLQGAGPRAAAKVLAQTLDTDEARIKWELEASMDAIVGSIAGSKSSVLSGIRAWMWFHARVLRRAGAPFPPRVDDLLCWSHTFQNAKTFVNYCSYVKVVHPSVGVETVYSSRAVF